MKDLIACLNHSWSVSRTCFIELARGNFLTQAQRYHFHGILMLIYTSLVQIGYYKMTLGVNKIAPSVDEFFLGESM